MDACRELGRGSMRDRLLDATFPWQQLVLRVVMATGGEPSDNGNS